MSSPLSVQLLADMKSAMREGNAERRDVIRYLRSALGNRKIELQQELTDDDVLAVIRTQIKQCTDAADIFRNADRMDLAEKEESQIAILREYLPAQMSQEELTAIVRAMVDEMGLQGPGDMGKLMPVLIEKIGTNADGRMISQTAREELSRNAP